MIGKYLTEPWGVDDTYGCGVDFQRRRVFFTKNGVVVGNETLFMITFSFFY